jgi:hypothetical protein
MTDLLTKIVLGLLRVVMAPIITWLISKNIITSDDSVKLLTEVAAYTVSIGWTIYAYIHAHRKQLLALTMSKGSTLAQLHDKMATETVALSTPVDATPIAVQKPGN